MPPHIEEVFLQNIIPFRSDLMEPVEGIKRIERRVNEGNGLCLKERSKRRRIIHQISEPFNEIAEGGDDSRIGEPVVGDAVVEHK